MREPHTDYEYSRSGRTNVVSAIKKIFCEHEYILLLTNARVRLAVVVIRWMCCSMTRYLVMGTPR